MEILCESNPYGSRTAVVGDDGQTVHLYLMTGPPDEPHDEIFSVWVANYGPAPDLEDVEAMKAGEAPRMPRRGTRHPDGLPPFRPEDLELVWFEEGDGVALLERGRPWPWLPDGSVTRASPAMRGKPWETSCWPGSSVPPWRASDRVLRRLAGTGSGARKRIPGPRFRRPPYGTWSHGWGRTSATGRRMAALTHLGLSPCSSPRPTAASRSARRSE